MNIFILDNDIKQSVRYYVDAHVRKITLEATQIMSCAYYTVGQQGPYKPTHMHHKVVKWAAENYQNWAYVGHYAIELCEEYRYRFGKTHACFDVIRQMVYDKPNLPNLERTDFPLCMPPEYWQEYTVDAYRAYYHSKSHLFQWTKREMPFWLKGE